MNYEIAIVGHFSRLAKAWDLGNQVNCRYITIDDGSYEPGHNHLRAWRWLNDSSAQWSVVLEDDARPVIGFNDQLTWALQRAPTPIVSLYLGRERPAFIQERAAEAVERPECWIMANRLYHHVGVAIKTSLLPLMLDTVTPLTKIMPIDEAIGSWACRLNTKVGYTHPSLVDHDDTIPSISTSHLPEAKRFAWKTGTRAVWDSSTYRL